MPPSAHRAHDLLCAASNERLTQVYDYEGPREAAGIVAEMERHADPAWTAPVNAVIDLTEESFDACEMFCV